jgi:ubiquinone biosynthesis protein COQ9
MTDRQAQKDALLVAALEHVAFDGWGRQALAAAARDMELDPTTARRLFPRGGESLLDAFDDWADRQMLTRLEALDVGQMRQRDRIVAAIRARLEALAPYREATRRAIAARALPAVAMGGFQNLWRTVDRMWLAAGDTKDDGMSVYTKRLSLAGIYTTTLLYWLEDTSLDQEDTWAFLDRRIDGVMRLQTMRRRAERFTNRLPFPRRRPGGRASV